MPSPNGILQTDTTIAKTTQTQIGDEIDCTGYDTLTLWFEYTKGDETGLLIIPWFRRVHNGTSYRMADWTTDATKTRAPVGFLLTASANAYIVIDVWGIDYVYFTQGGSNNDGSILGTLAASYTLKD